MHCCICRGWQNLIAYGSKTSVIVVDPYDVRIVQTLNLHSGFVSKASLFLLFECLQTDHIYILILCCILC